MIAYLNGAFLPLEAARVSVLDRGFLYGDGLFETLRVYRGRAFRWEQHLDRLEHGAQALGIPVPQSRASLHAAAIELVRQNQMPEAILRLALSRGPGPRGYSTRGALDPTLAMTLDPAPPTPDDRNPPQWRLAVASMRVATGDPLLRLKTANRLLNVLARAEAEARGADEAILLNYDGHLAEAVGSNVFWFEDATLVTPPLAAGLLPGVTRAVVFELCAALRIPVEERLAPIEALHAASGVFLSLSTLEIVEAVSLAGQPLRRSVHTGRLRGAYRALVDAETAQPGSGPLPRPV